MNVMLPISIPMVVTARTVDLRGMAVLLLLSSPPSTLRAVGGGSVSEISGSAELCGGGSETGVQHSPCDPAVGLRRRSSPDPTLGGRRYVTRSPPSRLPVHADTCLQSSSPRPISRPLPNTALGSNLWLHVPRLGADDSGDQPRPPLQRGEVPRPVHHHQQTVSEADQKIDMREAP